MNAMYRVSKNISGFSTCFRQWRATSHCRYLHGYALSFTLSFKSSSLNECHWVIDYGLMKNKQIQVGKLSIREWFDYMFDHTVIISDDDPKRVHFESMAQEGLIQLRMIPEFSTEKLAEYIFHQLQPAILKATDQRALIVQVDVKENEKNCASYCQPYSLEDSQ